MKTGVHIGNIVDENEDDDKDSNDNNDDDDENNGDKEGIPYCP